MKERKVSECFVCKIVCLFYDFFCKIVVFVFVNLVFNFCCKVVIKLFNLKKKCKKFNK